MEKSEYTEENYKYTIQLMEDEYGKTWVKQLLKPEKIFKMLQKKYDEENTIRSHINRISAYIRQHPELEIPEEIAEKYRKKMKEIDKVMETKEYKEKREKKIEEKWIPWKEIIKIREKLKEKADKGYNEYRNYLILSLYTYPKRTHRIDYSEMRIIKKFKAGKTPETYNYYVDSKKPLFVFNKYKNRKPGPDGQEIEAVPKELNNIIQKWLQKYNTERKYLLTIPATVDEEITQGIKSHPMSDNVLSRLVGDIFYKEIGKRVSVNIIRKIHAEERRGGAEAKKILEEDAKDLQHDIKTHMKYYIR